MEHTPVSSKGKWFCALPGLLQPACAAQVEHRIFEADELKPLLDAVNAETQKEKESEA